MPKTARLPANHKKQKQVSDAVTSEQKSFPAAELPKPRKIAIVGTAFTSNEDAPYDDPSWEIWNISANFQKPRRFDRWFEMHSSETLKEAKAIPEYFDFLKSCGDKLIVGFKDETYWPHARPYPIEGVQIRFGIFREYFTSSCAYMVALAIHEHLLDKEFGGAGIEEIGFWGVDMATKDEYISQRACLEWYAGIAFGQGIKLTVAKQSPILRSTFKYALDNVRFSEEMTGRLLEAKIIEDKMRVQALVTEKQYEYAKGCKDTLQVLCNYWNA